MIRRAAVLVFVFWQASLVHAQIFIEDFDAAPGTPLTALGWVAHRSAGINPLLISATPLDYPGYPASPLGGSVLIIGRSSDQGEDVHHEFPARDTGSVFVSFLLNVAEAPASGDYFMHLGPLSLGTTYRAKICTRSPAAGFISFGLSKSLFPDSSVRWTSVRYPLNTTHLLIMQYKFSTGGTANDTVALWIDPPLDSAMRAPDLIHADAGSDLSNVGTIILRQGSSASKVYLDALRVGSRWGDAPLSVRFASFTANFDGQHTIVLRWSTLSEIRNYGFLLFRAPRGTEKYQTVSPLISGHGTTLTRQDYAFIDSLGGPDPVTYRLKQIDLDGGETWSEAISPSSATDITGTSEATRMLNQSYPNPCNPTARISFVAMERERVVLDMYTILGQHLCTLYQGEVEPGVSYDVRFDGSRFAAGIYIYTLRGAAWKVSKRLVLEK